MEGKIEEERKQLMEERKQSAGVGMGMRKSKLDTQDIYVHLMLSWRE